MFLVKHQILNTVLIITLFNLSLSAQIDFDNPPWKTACESDPNANQTAMNECSYVQFTIADSVLNEQYNILISEKQKFYDEEKKYLKDENDSFTLNLLKQTQNTINAIKKSKIDFITFRNSSCEIVGYQYQGGSMAPLAINYHALELTVNQIKILEELKNE
ncbi:MAG: lysozyme inhibitor LprI family protein [Flavobacteriales bacterium]|nr:lysozyme inhibitor LprI family protein [Flavobacteriales bacterium]